MKRLWLPGILVLSGAAIFLSGCCGGETKTVKEQPIIVSPSNSGGTAPTVGQELQSLEEAYKKGIITKSQYDEAKKKILERAGK